MKPIHNAILDIDAHLSNEEFNILCLAIQEYQRHLPCVPLMKEIEMDIKIRTGKRTSAAISKALERAVAHIFETGDLETLARYQKSWRYEKPFPNEFIRVVALRLWDGNEALNQEHQLALQRAK